VETKRPLRIFSQVCTTSNSLSHNTLHRLPALSAVRLLRLSLIFSSILEELAVQFGTSSVLRGILSLVPIDSTVSSSIEARRDWSWAVEGVESMPLHTSHDVLNSDTKAESAETPE
jgi:hypothetical protein